MSERPREIGPGAMAEYMRRFGVGFYEPGAERLQFENTPIGAEPSAIATAYLDAFDHVSFDAKKSPSISLMLERSLELGFKQTINEAKAYRETNATVLMDRLKQDLRDLYGKNSLDEWAAKLAEQSITEDSPLLELITPKDIAVLVKAARREAKKHTFIGRLRSWWEKSSTYESNYNVSVSPICGGSWVLPKNGDIHF